MKEKKQKYQEIFYKLQNSSSNISLSYNFQQILINFIKIFFETELNNIIIFNDQMNLLEILNAEILRKINNVQFKKNKNKYTKSQIQKNEQQKINSS